MTEAEEKAAFALQLMQNPGDPFKAAIAAYPDNTNRALWVAVNWPNDEGVKAELKRLREQGVSLDSLPSKSELAKSIWDKMQVCNFADDYQKLAKLYAEVMGFIEKPQAQTNVNVVQQRVMVVRDHGTNEDWESALKRQQKALTNGEFVKH